MKCILLSRISTGQQNLEQQTKDLIKFAKSIGFKESDQIVIESVESAIKLSEEERQGLNRLKNCIETEPIDCVICWEPSRCRSWLPAFSAAARRRNAGMKSGDRWRAPEIIYGCVSLIMK